MFDFNEVADICMIYVSKNDLPNELIWNFEKKGYYTVKSGYKLCINSSNQVDGRDKVVWKGIWDTPASKKVQVLMWRAIMGILPMGISLSMFNIPVERTCKRCDGVEETVTHVLLQCYKAREVWRLQG